jgi:hypothetical protein
MQNHHHLLVETPAPNLARGMRQVNGVYAQAFSRRHRRDGHLFGGRTGGSWSSASRSCSSSAATSF